MEGLDLAS